MNAFKESVWRTEGSRDCLGRLELEARCVRRVLHTLLLAALAGLAALETGLALADFEGFVALIFSIYETLRPNMQNNSSKINAR